MDLCLSLVPWVQTGLLCAWSYSDLECLTASQARSLAQRTSRRARVQRGVEGIQTSEPGFVS